MTVKKEATTEINFSDHESTFSLSFSSIYRLFCAKANFFLNLFLLLKFFFFFSSRGNKQILVSLGRVQYCFVSLRLSFVVPWDNFCPKGWPFWVFLVNEKRSLSELEMRKKKKNLSSKNKFEKKWPWQKKSCK